MKKEITLKPTETAVASVTDFVEDILTQNDIPFKTIAQVNVAIDEIFSNIVLYSGADSVTVTCLLEENEIKIEFLDNGKPYDPTKNEDPDITLSSEERKIGGLGIFMVKKTMDDVSYVHKDNKNILTIKKHR